MSKKSSSQRKGEVKPQAPEYTPGSILSEHNWPLLAVILVTPVLALVILAGLIFASVHIYGDSWQNVRLSPQDTWTAGAAANPTKPPTSLVRIFITDAAGRQALCNDGSAAMFYFRPGVERFKDKWVIHLEGGGACRDEASCLARALEDPGLTSSVNSKASIKDFGIFSTSKATNTDFYGWNHVKLMYCSSDGWVGDSEQTLGGETWYFNGKNIVEAALEDLMNPNVIQTANLTQATEVVFSGSSAGGGGAVNNLDKVAGMLPWARVVGFIDSSWNVDIDPYLPVGGPTEAEVVAFQNRLLDESCLSDFPGEPERCVAWETMFPYIETPAFIFINQKDNVKLSAYGLNTPYDPAELNWINNTLRPNLISSFDLIEPTDGLYSPNLTFHTMLTSDRFFQPHIEGVSPYQVFGNWFFGRTGPTRVFTP